MTGVCKYCGKRDDTLFRLNGETFHDECERAAFHRAEAMPKLALEMFHSLLRASGEYAPNRMYDWEAMKAEAYELAELWLDPARPKDSEGE